MMNPFNRKMFNSKPSRPARNKLNQMGGIMASSQPLMQTVQKFKDGNTVRVPSKNPSIPLNRSLVVNPTLGTTGSRSVVPYQSPYQNISRIKNFLGATPVGLFLGDVLNTAPLKTADELSGIGEGKVQAYKPGQMTDLDINREQFDKLSEEDQQAYLQAENDRRFAKRAGFTAGIGKFANVGDTLANTFESITENPVVERAAKAAGLMDPTDSFEERNPKAFQQAREEGIAANRPLTLQQFRAALPSTEERAPRATTEEQYMGRQATPAETLIGMSTAPPATGDADPEVEVDDGDLNASVDTIVDSPVDDGDLADTQTLNASVENSAANELQRVFNQGTPEEVEKSLEELMLEFTSAAPERKGLDKGLAIAKIGFAMAAGQSPNAISNIASALSSGAGMFIKDKSEKDSFDRQVQLSALQYGIGEVGKRRQEGRIEARERRGVKDYVAGSKGVTYNGKKYNENETVPVLIGDIRDGNMPSGLISSSMVSAIAAKSKAVGDLLSNFNKERRKEEAKFNESKRLKIKDYTDQQDRYRKATDIALTSENAIGLLETVFLDISEGKVTGVSPGLKDVINKGANFFGFNLDKSYETKEAAQSAMRIFLQTLIPVTLGSSQSANSISNRDVEFLIGAFFGDNVLDDGSFQFVLKDADQLLTRLQRAADKMRESQKGAFAEMREIEDTLEPLFQPGTKESAVLGLSEQQKRLKEKGLNISGTTTGTKIGTIVDSEEKDDRGRPIFRII